MADRDATDASHPSVDAVIVGVSLPPWAQVSAKRRAHIQRVTALMESWAVHLTRDDLERRAWHDAAAWHDAVRDADETWLRDVTGDHTRPFGMLHGPAAALRLERDGESRPDVLDAVRWHTVGSANWGRLGRALYMADFLEPGRNFMQRDRSFLADRVPTAFDDTFRQVVRVRLEWAIREGKALSPETVALWNSVR